MNLALMGNAILRSAVQRNLVSFPSQIPAFGKHGDVKKRIVDLYFVSRWQTGAICNHYGLSKATVQKLLLEWKIRAVAAGYIQEIQPEALAVLASEEDADQSEVFGQSAANSDFVAPESGWKMAQSIGPAGFVSAARV
jgi:hypothetical protein